MAAINQKDYSNGQGPLSTDVDIHQDDGRPQTVDLREKSTLRKLQKKADHMRCCKTCFQAPSEVVSFPCGHINNCLECANVMKICAVCYGKIENFKHLYVPDFQDVFELARCH